MFVMLSVRTTATVRERPAETVKKAISINQFIRSINNRKAKKNQQEQSLNNAKPIGQSDKKSNNNNSGGDSDSNSSSDQKNLRRDKNSYQKPTEKIDKTSIQIIAPPTTTTTTHSPGRLVQISEEEEKKKKKDPVVPVCGVPIAAATNSVASAEKQDPQNVTQDSQDQEPKAKFLLPELNNFRKPPTVQVPVATILNDLSPVPAPAKVTNKISNSNPMSPMNPAGLQSNSPDVKAMRYYRLWIYTCNAVLLMAVIVFCGVAGKILLSDYRRLLVTGLSLTQPSFIYAYLALLVQSGFLQLIGCLGALRLSEKLLNAYWLLLLVLLIGDAMLGIFWMFKFDRVMNDLQPMLRSRLAHEYGNSIELTDLWDRLQNEGRCCGVAGPQDFPIHVNRTYPDSCCASDVTEQISISRRPLASAVVFRGDDLDLDLAAAGHNFSDISDAWSLITAPSSSSSSISGSGSGSISSSSSSSSSSASSGGSFSIRSSVVSGVAGGGGGDSGSVRTITACRAVYPQGCADRIVSWLRHTADVLFVLGYCVIAFLKLCFLGILRYEIKEMIQKIKLLQTEMAGAILNGVDCDQQQIQQFTLLQQVTSTSINGGIHAEPKVGNRDRERTRLEAAESERESLLNIPHQLQQQQQQQQSEPAPKLLKHRQLYTCVNEQHLYSGSGGGGGGGAGGPGAAVGGCESDTNSNCALLVEENNASLLSSTAGANKTINGNNNYELSEFDSKATAYRLLNAPTVTRI
ncbi:uncharacterized protein LOC131684849 [Topomyia yanbarensis]|uniref:uncharacterized protein LOC131684849 n=1 Tax=Topomyia yanbarensis TaxID=2498891 RepID=UPI00273BF8E6|nr:uncharacterized protein LOC131684849 [Topomyia yanbarensis]XP_058824047.1 uncharacterized protein LOC131684849 [Topomyia yanbarensis]